MCDFFDRNGNLKSLINLGHEYKIEKKMYFKWFQLIHAIPESWKKDIKIDQGNFRNLVYLSHRLIKNNQIYFIEKLKANELYFLSVSLRNTVPTSQNYVENFFPNLSFIWKHVYILPNRYLQVQS